MKYTMIYFMFFISIIQGYAQLPDLNSTKPVKKAYFEILSYEMRMGVPIIEVDVSGKKLSFMLDTGAITSISADEVKVLKLQQISSVEVSDSGANSSLMQVVNLPSLFLGSLSFKDVPAIVIQKPDFFNCLGIDGIIGSNLFNNSVIKISSNSKTITITDKSKNLDINFDNGIKMEINEMQSSPYIWVNFKNGDITARELLLIDTGMNGFYDLSINAYLEIFSSRNIFQEKYSAVGSYSKGIHGTAVESRQYKVIIPELSLAEYTFKNITANTTPTGTSRIGFGMFLHGDATLDYRNKKFYFTPYQPNELNKEEKSWPIEMLPDNNKLIVGIVWDPQLLDKINVGDEIIRLGDVILENTDLCTIMKNREHHKADKITLLLKDVITGKNKEVTIIKQ